MKNLYFFDVDGTLIEFRKEIYDISDNLKEALEKIKKRGDKFFISTGRAYGTLPPSIRNMNADGYSLCAGAFVTIGENVLRNVHFSKDDLNFMMERFLKHDVVILLECGFEIYSNAIDTEEGKKLLEMWAIDSNYVKPLRNYEDLKCNKISITFKNLEDIRTMEDFKDRGITVLPQPTEDSFDITLTSSTKKDGLVEIRRHFEKEDKLRLVAFGDSYNDMEMVSYADLGVAMGNAVDELKKVADYVTKDVDEDGIYEALKILGEI